MKNSAPLHSLHQVDLRKIEVLAPNFKRRLSGVSATLERVVPLQSHSIPIAALGPSLPSHVPTVRALDLRHIWKPPAHRPFRIWHARRNIEMFAGIFLRDILRAPLRLVFTSASQRHHTAWTRYLISKMNAVISTSDKTATYLKRPSIVIRHGIDPTQFSPAPDQNALRTQLGLPPLHFIGCFGRIRHQKGTDVFVDAMIRLLPSRPNFGAIVLGRALAPHHAFLANLVNKVRKAGLADRILFPEEVPPSATPQWYAALDLFIAPQRWEGFGVTPLEAMASGIPVVATTVGAFPELIVPNVTGNLVPPGDVNALHNASAHWIDHPDIRAQAAIAARQHVIDNFALSNEANAINAVYDSIWHRENP